MSAEQAFSIANLAAMLGWIALIVFPRRPWASTLVPTAVPLLLAVVYTILVIVALPGSTGSFSSLAGVARLFENPWALLAGWVHYLAFDLFIGGWEVRDAQQRGVRHIVVIPCLILTFMLGPAGLMLYFIVRRVSGPDTRARPGDAPSR